VTADYLPSTDVKHMQQHGIVLWEGLVVCARCDRQFVMS